MKFPTPVKLVLDFFSSYLLAAVTMALMCVLTLFGTLEQVDHGIYEVQKRYFESFFVVHHLFGRIPFMLPGGYLLMSVLFLNLLCGAILSAPKNWRRPGMLIAHGGILYLLVAGFVTYHYSTSGHMTLFEGESAGHFQSYHEWELVVAEVGGDEGRVFRIDHDTLMGLDPARPAVFHADGLPFDIMIEGFQRNTVPRPVAPGIAQGIDGIQLEPLPLEKESERNVAGCYVVLVETGGAPGGAHAAAAHGMGGLRTHEAILWGLARVPWRVEVDGQVYAVDLRHARFKVPFNIRLEKFTRELHPRTGMASNFESLVTKTEGRLTRQIEIKMNQPLRHEGFTFFQASWGPENAAPGEPLFSTFAVVNNPADQWPLYSCLVIAAGLLIHFIQKLLGYLRMENSKRARA